MTLVRQPKAHGVVGSRCGGDGSQIVGHCTRAGGGYGFREHQCNPTQQPGQQGDEDRNEAQSGKNDRHARRCDLYTLTGRDAFKTRLKINHKLVKIVYDRLGRQSYILTSMTRQSGATIPGSERP